MAKSYKRWVEDLVARVAKELNLSHWRFNLHIDEPDPDGDSGTIGFTQVNGRYLIADICFTPTARSLWDRNDMTLLTECVVHEITHTLLNPLHEFAKQAASEQTMSHLTDILEQTNQQVTRIVIAHLPKKFFSR